MKSEYCFNALETTSTDVIVRIFPVSEAGKSLDDLNPLPTFRKCLNSKVMGKLLTTFEQFRFEEFAASHDKGGEEEWAFGTNVGDRMECGIEEVDEGVEAQKDEVEEDLGLLLVDDT